MSRIKRRKLKGLKALRRRQERLNRQDIETGVSHERRYQAIFRNAYSSIGFDDDDDERDELSDETYEQLTMDVDNALHRLKKIEMQTSPATRMHALEEELRKEHPIHVRLPFALAMDVELKRQQKLQGLPAQLLQSHLDLCSDVLVEARHYDDAIELWKNMGRLERAYEIALSHGRVKTASELEEELDFMSVLQADKNEEFAERVDMYLRTGDRIAALEQVSAWAEETSSQQAIEKRALLSDQLLGPSASIQIDGQLFHIRCQTQFVVGRGHQADLRLKGLKYPKNAFVFIYDVEQGGWTTQHGHEPISTNTLAEDIHFEMNPQQLYFLDAVRNESHWVAPKTGVPLAIIPNRVTVTYHAVGTWELTVRGRHGAIQHTLFHAEHFEIDGLKMTAIRL